MFLSVSAYSQDTAQYITIAAGTEYEKPLSFQKKWGRNRRQEWTTAVRVPYLWLQDVYGGIKPYRGGGGGNETKSLRLRSSTGKELVLRSINKSREEVVPEFAKGTFIQDIIQDGVSMSHPYGAFALAGMQDAAGINHTFPLLVYLPPQEALDSFNTDYANDLYMFEERPDEDWSDADHLGNSEKYTSTTKVIEKLLKSSHHRADQFAFAKARLFDMLVGDWDRHADNYRWAKFDDSLGYNIYEPVPRDRDQVFYTHNGMFIDRLINMSGLDFMISFDHKVGDVTKVPRQQIDMDKFFTNGLDKKDWLRAATELQVALTDSVISQSLRRMPPEVYAVSGKEITDKLISRRAQIGEYAEKYYLFLAEKITVTGSNKPEEITISSPMPQQTKITIRIIDKDSRIAEDFIVYERTFHQQETKEIKIFGIADDDIYYIDKSEQGIKIKIYAGEDKDSINIKDAQNVILIDDKSPHVTGNQNLLQTTIINSPPTFAFHSSAAKGGLAVKPYLYYSNQYLFKKAIGVNAIATLPKPTGKWTLQVNGFFSPIRWTNYFGTGNESQLLTKDRQFYRYKSMDWGGGINLKRKWTDHKLTMGINYIGTKIYEYNAGFLPQKQQKDTAFSTYNYASAGLQYDYENLNQRIVPDKGIAIQVATSHWQNFSQNSNFQRYSFTAQSYVPIIRKVSFALKTGITTIGGERKKTIDGQFFQNAVAGGPETIRGYRSQRFWGRTAYYNQNELRYITDWRNKLFNAKLGLLLFADNGRVWSPGENSNKIHTGYGAGFLFAPFYQMLAVLTYGISQETNLLQFTLRTSL